MGTLPRVRTSLWAPGDTKGRPVLHGTGCPEHPFFVLYHEGIPVTGIRPSFYCPPWYHLSLVRLDFVGLERWNEERSTTPKGYCVGQRNK